MNSEHDDQNRHAVTGFGGLCRSRLPLNRKERFYTGTALPMIVACDGFAHLGRFLELCGAPAISVDPDPAATNIQFFTEYGFKESLMDGAESRFGDPGGKDTPDLVLYIEGEPSVLLGVEAKMFHRPSMGELDQQLQTQAKLLSVMAQGVTTKPEVHHVALLPAGLQAPSEIAGVPVVTWEAKSVPADSVWPEGLHVCPVRLRVGDHPYVRDLIRRDHIRCLRRPVLSASPAR